jgi:hypothetical protein
MPKGFASKAQWRMFFANKRLRRWAHKEAHKTMAARGGPKVGYRSLPARKTVRGKRRR